MIGGGGGVQGWEGVQGWSRGFLEVSKEKVQPSVGGAVPV